LTRHLDNVCSALVAAVEGFDGSVVTFAGDATICWFDEADGSIKQREVTSPSFRTLHCR
jgi:hypothetical protein